MPMIRSDATARRWSTRPRAVLLLGAAATLSLAGCSSVGDRLPGIRRYGLRLFGFALLAPLGLSLLGAATGIAMGLSVGGVAIMATLAASASYIAAPTAMRIAVAEADSALAITAALAITFPFNLLVGIPMYLQLARWVTG